MILLPDTGRDMLPESQIDEWFAMFWLIYWRRVARKDAMRAFQKQVRDEETFAAVMEGVRIQHCSMMNRQPDFRPHAATWLNGERWTDELPLPVNGNSHKSKFQIANESVED